MKIYTILLNDRHVDPHVEVRRTQAAAIARAHELAKEAARFPEDIEVVPISGWILHINYSCEGDSVTVREAELPDDE